MIFSEGRWPDCPNSLSPQQRRPSLTDTAHVWSPPAITALVGADRFTATGNAESPMVPLPSWPWSFFPQHHTLWSLSSAQV